MMNFNRVNQIHSSLLDQELWETLIPSIHQITQSISLDRYNLEFITFLKFYWISTSLKHHQTTFGSKLSNLKFNPSSSNHHTQYKSTNQSLGSHQLSIYIILKILPSYLNSRLRDYMLSSSWSDYTSTPNLSSLFSSSTHPSIRKKYWFRFIWDTYNLLDQIDSSAKFINFSIFLYNGQYRSLMERLLKIQWVSSNSINSNQTLSFEYLNRQLVWESITDFIIFILPFINLKRTKLRILQIQSKLSKFLKSNLSLRPNPNPTPTPTSSLTNPNQVSKPKQTPYQSLPKTTCPICISNSTHQNPFNNPNHQVHQSFQPNSLNLIQTVECQVKVPYVVDCCDGLYCYSCLINSILKHRSSHLNQNWECWRCGEIVKSLKRFHP
ncbi:uncharacterized protein MELLADRAFT_84390 [Melampsora larici-populina 98AG31]|uniref:RING-type E3 ubiquitin transferase (cysteine targeting) n=1 Tax=Melampsora larici-populina (strain 98AG31 / pathotype 3-4-7) TaxID=747676 RepID=F4RFL0_MELLP|nr:uncharacterized protein MELLADRAFT_84390 [Melampsora larici-populina 98AG31]EGG08824.1 hypothetical protein MELLADRAFT_84390 [Melampsora larici-populina 98AG31]